MSVCTYEGEKRTKEREIVKNTRGKGQSITRKCGMVLNFQMFFQIMRLTKVGNCCSPHILFFCPLKLNGTPVDVTATKDSKNNLTTSMESLQACTQSQIQFQGLGDHEWEVRHKIADLSC